MRRQNDLRYSLLVWVMLVSALAVPAGVWADGGRRIEGQWSLVLEGAVAPLVGRDGSPGSARPQPLQLDTEMIDGRWDGMVGMAPTFNRGHHRGRVLSWAKTDAGVRLEIEMNIASDPWVLGGRGHYEVELTWQGDGRLEGTFAGTFGGGYCKPEPMAGRAWAQRTIPPPKRAGHQPMAPGEHPRVLFRKADIPRIRQRRKHPVCKAAWERIRSARDDAVCLGVMYQLTGDRKYAQAARPIVWKRTKERGRGSHSTGHVWGERLADVALAYDLCRDAWDDEFNRKIVGYIDWITGRLIYRPSSVSPKVNWSPNSNYHNFLRGGAAIGSLVLMTDRGPEPAPPRDPGQEPTLLAAPEGYRPTKGVPVVPYRSGQRLTDWLVAGPLPDPRSANRDFLAHLGGSADAAPRIRPGVEVRDDGASATFEPLERDERFFWGERVEFTGVYRRNYDRKEDGYFHTAYFLTVVDNDRERIVQWVTGQSGSLELRAWISGREVFDKEFIQLAPGRHPVLIRAHVTETSPWGKIWMEPRLVDATRDQAVADLARRQVLYKLALAEWKEDHAGWQATGGANPRWLYLAKLGRYHMAQCYRHLMGDGGWQIEGEGYTLYSIPLPLEYATAHWKVFGRDVTGRPDVNVFPCRYVAQTIFGGPKPVQQSFSLTDGTMKAGHYARVFPIVPDRYKPAVLWAWHRTMGLTPAGQGRPRVGSGRDAVYTLLHYPVELEAKNPAEVLPNVWAAVTKGGYVFRNEWQGAEDIVFQAFLKSEGTGGWNNPDGGSTRLFGLGHPWAVRGEHPGKVTSRWHETVVMLPDDDIRVNGPAKVTHFDPREDGSGVLAADLNAIYLGNRRDAKGKVVGTRDLGIRGTRCWAVDYSGRSGAPAVFVMVDRITGGGRKVWQWQLPELKGPSDEVSIEGNRFTVRQGQASLVGTFLQPADVQVTHARGKVAVRLIKDRRDETVHRELNAIHASGADATAGDFVVVLTLQKGPAPAVDMEGDGEVLRIGDRRVRILPGRLVWE
jgi:hypothetical protein